MSYRSKRTRAAAIQQQPEDQPLKNPRPSMPISTSIQANSKEETKLTNQLSSSGNKVRKPLESSIASKNPLESIGPVHLKSLDSLRAMCNKTSIRTPHTNDSPLVASSHKMTSSKMKDKCVDSMEPLKNLHPPMPSSTSILGHSKEANGMSSTSVVTNSKEADDSRWGPFSPPISMIAKASNVAIQGNKPGAIWKNQILTRSLPSKLTDSLPSSGNKVESPVMDKNPLESLSSLHKKPSIRPPHTNDNPLVASSHKMTSNKMKDKCVESTVPSMIAPKNKFSKKLEPPTKNPSTTCPRGGDVVESGEFSVDVEQVENPETSTQEKPQKQAASKEDAGKNVQSYTIRRRVQLPGFTNPIEYDDKQEVLTIDADGKHQLVSGSIQPIDVWNGDGVRYYVHFNDLNQPIRKGGQIFTRFLGTIAKQERFCPVGEEDWHDVDDILKKSIINEIRNHFVIPKGDVYNNIALQRVDRSWRQYKYTLKLAHYKPNEKSIEAICAKPPPGVSRQNWLKLVKYWDSDKGKKNSKCGKEARASQLHNHTLGGTSYANMQADYEDEHGEKMSLIKLYENSHKRKDGSFIDGTSTADFLSDAKAKAEQIKLCDRSCSKTSLQIDNEAFDTVMYGGEIPDRPVGYGFGVRKSTIFGVNGLIRKEGYGKGQRARPVEMEDMKEAMSATNKRNEELHKVNTELQSKLQENTDMLMSVLDLLRTGKVSSALLDAAQSTLRMNKPEDHNGSGATN